jgi:transcriptional regulator with XRE-family HTH domain
MTNSSPSDVASRRIREARQRRGWTVKELADKCADAGAPHITATVITNLETRRHSTREITLDEVLALARVLEVTPLQLMIPLDADETLEPVSGVELDAMGAISWIAADDRNFDLTRRARSNNPEATGRALQAIGPEGVLPLVRLLRTVTREIARAGRMLNSPEFREKHPGSDEGTKHRLRVLADRLMHFAARMEALGYTPPRLDATREILRKHGLPSTLEEWRAQAAKTDDPLDLDGDGGFDGED